MKFSNKKFFIVVIGVHCLGSSIAKIMAGRDPFFLPELKKIKKYETSSELQLIGIIECENQIGAIVRSGDKKKIVFIGDKIDGFCIQEISLTHIFLKKGSILKTLMMS